MADIIMDEVFGELKYLRNKRWGKRMDAPLYNSDGNLMLTIEPSEIL